MIQSIDSDNRITAKFSDSELPRIARNGELYVVGGVLYIYGDLDNTGFGRWFPLSVNKKVYTFTQSTESTEWIIPIDFYTSDLEVVVYDASNRVFPHTYTVDATHTEIKLTFLTPLKGQAYIFVSREMFSWVDNKFTVGDNNNFSITQDPTEPGAYYLQINTRHIEILKNGDVTFRQNLTVSGNLQVTGNANIDGDLSIQGENVNINTTTLTVKDNVVTLNKGFSGIPTTSVGLEVDRGDEGVLSFVTFDETSDIVVIPVKQGDGTFVQDEVAGKTYVASEVSIINAKISSAENTLTDGVSTLTNSVNTEVNRAIAAELVLTNNLTDEVNRAIAAELVLTNNLTDEVNRAIAAEAALTTGISDEYARATATEFVLQTKIKDEQSARESADVTLTTNLDNEVARALAAETVLQNNIDVEKGRIDSILSASTADADSFKEIVDLINSVDTANDTAFAGYVSSNNERSSIIEQSVSDETTRATAAESQISTNLQNVVNAIGTYEEFMDGMTGQ